MGLDDGYRGLIHIPSRASEGGV